MTQDIQVDAFGLAPAAGAAEKPFLLPETTTVAVEPLLTIDSTSAPMTRFVEEPAPTEVEILHADLAAAEAKLAVLESRVRVWVDDLIASAPHPWQKAFHLHLLDNLEGLIARVKERL